MIEQVKLKIFVKRKNIFVENLHFDFLIHSNHVEQSSIFALLMKRESYTF